MFFSNLFQKKQYAKLGIAAIIASNLTSHFDIVFGKKILMHISPLFLSFISMFFSACLLLCYVEFKHHMRQFFKLPKSQMIAMTASTLLSAVLGPVLFLQGLQMTSATNATLFINLSPLFLSILGIFFLKEKLTGKLIFGIMMTLMGLVILATKGFEQSFSLQTGDIIVITAALGYGLSNIIFKKYIKEEHMDILLTYRSLSGMIMLFIGMIFFYPQSLLEMNQIQPVLTEIWAYTILTVVITYILHYWALENVSVQTFSVVMLSSPIIGILYANIFLHEPITMIHVISTTVMIAGIGFCKLNIGKDVLAIKNRLRHLHNGA